MGVSGSYYDQKPITMNMMKLGFKKNDETSFYYQEDKQ